MPNKCNTAQGKLRDGKTSSVGSSSERLVYCL